MSDNRVNILLTACVDPGGMVNTELTDVGVRKRQYIEAIEFYLSHTDCNIVVCENTGTGLFDEVSSVEKHSRLEYLTFCGNDYDKSIGKAYGEGRIIKYALEHSRTIDGQGCVIKITGRVKVLNINDIVRRLRNSPSVDRTAMVELSAPGFARSVCFAAPAKWLSESLGRYGERLSESFWFETMLYESVKESSRLKIIPCFPIIDGVCGSRNNRYDYPDMLQRRADHYGTLSVIASSHGEALSAATNKVCRMVCLLCLKFRRAVKRS